MKNYFCIIFYIIYNFCFGQNLLQNPSFEIIGGFETEYTQEIPTGISNSGSYYYASNSELVDENQFKNIIPQDGNTMLVIDGQEDKSFWKQKNILISSDYKYTFSFWIININKESTNNPNVKFEISSGNKDLFFVNLVKGSNLIPQGNWTEITYEIVPLQKGNHLIDLNISTINATIQGHDFAIDNLDFYQSCLNDQPEVFAYNQDCNNLGKIEIQPVAIEREHIFISEVTDDLDGWITYIELFNGTKNDLKLDNYKLEIYNNGSNLPTRNCIVNLNGIIQKNKTFVVKVGRRFANPNPEITPNQIFDSGCLGINNNDNIRIRTINNNQEIDVFGYKSNKNFAPINRGFVFRRKPVLQIPKTEYSPDEWIYLPNINRIIDYSNMGKHFDFLNADYSYTINGKDYSKNTIFENLNTGKYLISIKNDKTNCISPEKNIEIKSLSENIKKYNFNFLVEKNVICKGSSTKINFKGVPKSKISLSKNNKENIYFQLDSLGDFSLETDFLTEKTSYKINSITYNNCELEYNKEEIIIDIQQVEAPNVLEKIQKFCSFKKPKLSELKIIGQNLKYYDENGNLLSSEDLIDENKIYFATQTINSCESIKSEPIKTVFISFPKNIFENKYYLCNNQNSENFILNTKLDSNVYEFIWNTGENTSEIKITKSGIYSVKVRNKTLNESCEMIYETEVLFTDAPILLNNKIFNKLIEVLVYNQNEVLEYSLNGINWQKSNFFENLKNGIYTVFVKNKLTSCISWKDFNVIEISNFISPNSSINSIWKVEGLESFVNINLKIFDRYGKIIKESNDSKNFTWNGTLNQRILPSGTYWYQITFEDKNKLIGYITMKK